MSRCPSGCVPGVPLQFATALPLAGYGRGVLAISIDGPADQDRGQSAPSRKPRRHRCVRARPRSCRSTIPTARKARARTATTSPRGAHSAARCGRSWNAKQARRGAGLRMLTGRITSPTLLRQIDGLLKHFRRRAGIATSRCDDDASAPARVLAFGRPLTALPRFERRRRSSSRWTPIRSGPGRSRCQRRRLRSSARNATPPSRSCASMRPSRLVG